ncbi:MAG: ribosome hibernation-promoting factor, HPF/YfiA family [Bacteriovoracia bacterium]
MKLTITFKHLEHTPALDERIREKSEKLHKYLGGHLDVQWICGIEDNEHWAEVKIHGGHNDFFAKASADNMYKCLDKVIEKVERQLEKQKGSHNKIHSRNRVPVTENESEVVE